MFALFRNFLGISSTTSTYDSYILYGTIAISIIFFVVLIDLVYKLIRSFTRK